MNRYAAPAGDIFYQREQEGEQKTMKKNRIISLICLLAVLFNIFIFTNTVYAAQVTTVIDLTGLATGAETSHDCNKYLTTKYDSSQHWQECTICGKIYGNRTNHSYSEYWTMGDSCSPSNKLVHSCSCGYSYRTDNTREHKQPFINYNNAFHIKDCKYCLDLAYYSVPEKHYDSGGELGCRSGRSGTCLGCNAYIPVEHSTDDGYDYVYKTWNNKGCAGCGKILTSDRHVNVSYNGTHASISNVVTLKYPVDEIRGTMAHYYNSRCGTVTNSYYSLNGNVLNLYIECDTIDNFESAVGVQYDVRYKGVDGQLYWLSNYVAINPEDTAPVIGTISQRDINFYNGWSTGKEITVSGVENYCSSVKLTMTDSSGNVYLNNVSVPVSNKNWSYSFIPDIEADANGKTFTVTATDTLGNSSTKTFTVYKTDKKSPTMTSATETSKNWSKTKDFTFVATDEGSGKVQIAFNNVSDYKLADASGKTFSRPYQFTGDVYGNVTAAVYLKDAVGNETTQFIKIYNLDNTAPTITETIKSLSDDAVNIAVTANDINKTLNASGSGVSQYAVTTTKTAPSTGWQNSNSFTVFSNGTYYVWAKDAVGNISNYKEVKVTELVADYTVNHFKQNLAGNYPSRPTETYTTKGDIGASVTPAVKNYEGFTSPDEQTITIKADGSSTVDYYYTRNVYTLTLNRGTGISTVSGAGSKKYGSSVTINATVKPGYTFKNWTGTFTTSIKNRTFNMPAKNVTLTANATPNPNTPYKVRHWVQKVTATSTEHNKTQYELIGTDYLTGTTDTLVTPPTKPLTGKYEGCIAPPLQTKIILGDGSTVIDYYYDRTKIALDINGEYLEITYNTTDDLCTFDVYINKIQVANDVTDYKNDQILYGSIWEVKDINSVGGKHYYGVDVN